MPLEKMPRVTKNPRIKKPSKAQRTIRKSEQGKAAVFTDKDARRLKNTKRKTITNKKGQTVNVSKNTKTGAVTRSKTVTNKKGEKVNVTRVKTKKGKSLLRNNQTTGVKTAKATNARGKKSTATTKTSKHHHKVPIRQATSKKPGSAIRREAPKRGGKFGNILKRARKEKGTVGKFH